MNDDKSGSLDFTGERFVPDVHGDLELEHIHRYLIASRAVAGKSVLDIASGEGYGSALLAKTANRVIGVDISYEAVRHARMKYRAVNLEFCVGSCLAIPLANASVDIVVSFETIEHLADHDGMMREIRRVLRPSGVVILSSPDKLEYSDKRSYCNPYHCKELYRDEFKRLLGLHFRHIDLYGQRVIYGSAIFSEDGVGSLESYEFADKSQSAILGLPHAVYLVAVASDADLPVLVSGILEQPIDETELVLRWAGCVAERDVQIDFLNTELVSRDAEIVRIKSTVSWKITKPLRALRNTLARFLSHGSQQ